MRTIIRTASATAADVTRSIADLMHKLADRLSGWSRQ